MLRMIALLGLLAAPPATTTGRASSSKWTVDFADDQCVATRSFTLGGTETKLAIKPPLDSAGATRLMVQKSVKEVRLVEPDVAVDFGDGAKPYKTTMHLALRDSGIGFLFDLPASEARRLRQARIVDLKSSAKVGGRFELGPIVPLYAALDRCIADLRQRVGLGSGPSAWVENAQAKQALGPLFSWSNFQTVEIRSPKTSKVTVSLLIDKAGAVRDCSVTAGSGSAGLDIQTCQVFERNVSYRPARNRAGDPVASLLSETIDWRM